MLPVGSTIGLEGFKIAYPVPTLIPDKFESKSDLIAPKHGRFLGQEKNYFLWHFLYPFQNNLLSLP